MKFQLSTETLDTLSADAIIIGVLDGQLTTNGLELNTSLHQALREFLSETTQLAKAGDCALLPCLGTIAAKHILLIHLGSTEKLTADAANKHLQNAAALAHRAHLKSIVYALNDITTLDARQTLYSAVIALHHAYYHFHDYKKNAEALILEKVIIFSTKLQEPVLSQALQEAEAIVAGMHLTMNLANCPPNVCHPQYLAQQAETLSTQYSTIKTIVLDHQILNELGAGAILAVGQGSPNKPNLICMHYRGGKENEQPYVLLGKGITFDTGGNDLKQPANMLGMKYDMSGAATVFGVINAVARLGLPVNLVGVIAAAENMPGGDAYRPEDVITSMSGKTIEILNTDAEGRLVLCDALTYIERFKPKAVIDIATLTGAIMVTLGDKASGLFSNNDELANQLIHAAQQSRDKVWRLPIWEEYTRQLDSDYADLGNIGGPNAGSITAACFLAEFATAYPWAHLDIAGTASNSSGLKRNATGRPVRLLMEYLLQACRHS